MIKRMIKGPSDTELVTCRLLALLLVGPSCPGHKDSAKATIGNQRTKERQHD
jgi:hypothetical protein